MIYRTRNDFTINVGFVVNYKNVLHAVETTNSFLSTLPDALFRSIDFKTTGAMIGAIFCSHLASGIGESASVNPIEKGHPDIIPSIGLEASEEILRNYPQGLEIKGTIGNIRKNANLRAGEQRVTYLNGITWQAHHQEVHQLMSFVWDFIGIRNKFGFSSITGVFYSDKLSREDWGQISGTTGRNTKVSGMTTSGKRKMGQGWVLMLDDTTYIEKFKQFLYINNVGK